MTHKESLLRWIRHLCAPMEPLPTGIEPVLTEIRDTRAVLFDVYGTLFISASGDIGSDAIEGGALRKAFNMLDLPAPPAEGALQRNIRLRHEEAWRRGIAYPEVDIRDVWRDVLGPAFPASDETIEELAVIYECLVNPVWLMPGMRECLDLLRSKGLLLGIVSNAQFYTPLLFEALAGAAPETLGFTPSLCAWSFELGFAKPSPDLVAAPLRALAANHGILPHEVVMIGNDSRKDIAPAFNVGCKTIQFAGDARSYRPSPDGAPADALVRALTDVPHLLKTNASSSGC